MRSHRELHDSLQELVDRWIDDHPVGACTRLATLKVYGLMHWSASQLKKVKEQTNDNTSKEA